MMRRRLLLALLVLAALSVGLLLSDSGAPEAVAAKKMVQAARAGSASAPARGPRFHLGPSAADREVADEPASGDADTGATSGAVEVDLELLWPDGSMLDETVMLVGRGCPVVARVTEGNGTLSVARHWPTCALQARLSDGLLWRRTEWVDVDLGGDDHQLVQLVMPEERTGGLGVAIAEADEGIEVIRVYPGTPAYELGLQAGDVIVEVDGLPATALELDEFIEVATGPEGSEVGLVVAYGSDTGATEESLEVPRSFLSYSLVGGYHHGGHPTVHSPGTLDEDQ